MSRAAVFLSPLCCWKVIGHDCHHLLMITDWSEVLVGTSCEDIYLYLDTAIETEPRSSSWSQSGSMKYPGDFWWPSRLTSCLAPRLTWMRIKMISWCSSSTLSKWYLSDWLKLRQWNESFRSKKTTNPPFYRRVFHGKQYILGHQRIRWRCRATLQPSWLDSLAVMFG